MRPIRAVPPEPGTVNAEAIAACEVDWLEKLKTIPDFKKLTQGGKSDFYYVFRIAFLAGAVTGVNILSKNMAEAELNKESKKEEK